MKIVFALRAFLGVVLLAILASVPLRADTIAAWDFEGFDSDNLAPPYPWATTNGTGGGYNDANLETLVLSAHNLSALSQADFYRFQDWGNDSTELDAISTAGYWEITVDPKINCVFSLDPVDTFRGSMRYYETMAYTVLRSSLDGFTSNVDTFGELVDGAANNGQWHLDIGTGFSNLSSAVIFRMYGANPSGATGRITFRPDEQVATGALEHVDLIINGSTVLIPEPAAAVAALALGIVAVVRFRDSGLEK
jgi:hypothetical protein